MNDLSLARIYDWVLAHPWETLGIVLLATILARPVQWAVERAAKLIEAPLELARRELAERALAAVRPWSFERMMITTSSATRAAMRPVQSGMRTTARVASRDSLRAVALFSAPVSNITAWIMTFVAELHSALSSGQAFARRQIDLAIARLGAAPSQRIIGSVIFAIASALFVYADAGLLINTFTSLMPEARAQIPEFLLQLPVQHAMASFLSFAMLGIVLFDVLGLTHVGPWSALTGSGRGFLFALVAILLALLVIANGLVSFWRADNVQTVLEPAQREMLGFLGLGLIQPLMLLISMLIFAGAIDFITVLWLLVAALVWLLLSGFRLVAALLRASVLPLVAWALELALRGLVILVLVIAAALIAAASGATSALLLLGVALFAVVLVVAVQLWKGCWALLRALLQIGAAIVLKGGDLIRAVIDIVMFPVVLVWNWITRLGGLGSRLRLQPVELPSAPISAAGTPTT